MNPFYPKPFFPLLTFLLFALAGLPSVYSQSALSGSGIADDPEFFVTLDAYVKYGGNIKVVDGLTGREYHSDNKVVKAIHSNFPKIMGGLHKRLLDLETLHMKYHLQQGALHEKELAALGASFGITNFKLDRSKWLTREQAILARLRAKPFFQIKELVVWELEYMDEILPENKYARNIRFVPSTQSWERRVLTEWRVHVPTRKGMNLVLKYQGLNLDTNLGFHMIRDRGLPADVHPNSFQEVSVSYPIIVSKRRDTEEQIQELQRGIVKNMTHLYDPFTWIGRRNTRFRKVFSTNFVNHLKNRNYKIKDRAWFDPALGNFLNDVVTVNRHGLKEVYDLHIAQSDNPRNRLGEGYDPLNWNPKENRKGSGGASKPRPMKLKFENATGARFVLFDMYLRYGNAFLSDLRGRLTSLNRKEESEPIFRASIEAVSGVPADKYIQAALKAQEKGLNEYRNTHYVGYPVGQRNVVGD